MVQSLLLNYQADYNYNEQSQYQGVSNQLIFSQSGKIGYDEGETKQDKKEPEETLTTSPAMIMDKKVAIQETVNAPHIQISKSMQKHSVR